MMTTMMIIKYWVVLFKKTYFQMMVYFKGKEKMIGK